jgi:hypothetical protein
VPVLLAAVENAAAGPGAADGGIAVDGDRLQPLAAVYSTTRLTDAVTRHERDGSLTGLGVFRLIAGLDLDRVAVPAGSTDDVDTWADAARLRATAPTETTASQTSGSQTSGKEETT